jgi:hypothetical protein
MEEYAILKSSGRAIALGDQFQSPKFSIYGFLIGFTYVPEIDDNQAAGEYFLLVKSQVKQADREKYRKGKFVRVSDYDDYRNSSSYSIDTLYQNAFIFFTRYLAPIGTTIKVKRIDFTEYTTYYRNIEYEFQIQEGVIYRKLEEVNGKKRYVIPIPDNVISVNPVTVDLSNNTTGRFYARYFADVVDTSDKWKDLGLPEKQDFARMTTLICFRMARILDDFLYDVLLTPSDYTDMIGYLESIRLGNQFTDRNSIMNMLSGRSQYFQSIFFLLVSWGYNSVDPSMFVEANNEGWMDHSLPDDPDVQTFLDYYASITNFGHAINTNKLKVKAYTDQQKLNFLFEVLPSVALEVFPFDLKILWLQYFIKKEIDYETYVENYKSFKLEDIVWFDSYLFRQLALSEVSQLETQGLKILSSFSQAEANDLLDFLLTRPDGAKSYYELLYDLFDDERRSRYFFISFFVDPKPNRMHFAFLIYEIWTVSKYNPNFISAAGEIEPNSGVGADNFFTNEGASYFESYDAGTNQVVGNPSFMHFRSKSDGYTFSDYSFEPEQDLVDGIKVRINEVVESISVVSTPVGATAVFHPDQKSVYGEYHLYQPIVLFGNKEDLDFTQNGYEVPDSRPIPAFLFHYTEEYERIKEFDALANLAIEITVEIALFIIFGGTSAVRHVRHIRHIRKLHQLSQLPASEVVLFWKSVSAVGEIFSVTTSMISSLGNYAGQITNDPDQLELYKRISQVFGFMALTGGALSARASFLAGKKAREAKDLAEQLRQQNRLYPPGFNNADDINRMEDAIEVMARIGNDQLEGFTTFRNFIDNVTPTQLGGPNNISAIFNGFSAAKQDEFYRQFGTVFNLNVDNVAQIGPADLDILKLFNQNGGEFMNRWDELYDFGVPINGRNLDVLESDELFTAYQALFGDTVLRPYLVDLGSDSRQFVESFKNADNDWIVFLKTKPDAIARWKNLDDVTRATLKEMDDPDFWIHYLDAMPVGSTLRKPRVNYVVTGPPRANGKQGDILFIGEKVTKTSGSNTIVGYDNVVNFYKQNPTPALRSAALADFVDNIYAPAHIYDLNKATNAGYPFPPTSRGACPNLTGNPPGIEAYKFNNSNLVGNGKYSDLGTPPLYPPLTEDLTSIIQKIENASGEASVAMTSIRNEDYKGFWAALDIDPRDGARVKQILDLEIHHLDDMDGAFKGTLQLADKRIHKVTKTHTGNHDLFTKFLDRPIFE